MNLQTADDAVQVSRFSIEVKSIAERGVTYTFSFQNKHPLCPVSIYRNGVAGNYHIFIDVFRAYTTSCDIRIQCGEVIDSTHTSVSILLVSY